MLCAMRNSYTILIGKFKHFGDKSTSGRIILKWISDKCWIKLVKDSVKWNAFVVR